MEINNKKRKFSDIVSCFHGTKEHIKLKIQPIDYLLCTICNKRIYDYRLHNKDYVCCSYDCYSILYLQNKNGYLDENKEITNFNDDMKI